MNLVKDIQIEKDAQDILALLYEGEKLFIQNCSAILDLADRLKLVKESHLKKLESQPYHINVISMAARGKLKETAHSAILQCLLKNQAILDSFVKDVLNLDGYSFNTNDVRIPDKERMDVSIYGKEACIIIENKVNSACEQEGQIYRYVELAKESYSNDNIFVVYLNPDHYSKPTDYSLTEHGLGQKKIPTEIEDRLIIKTYNQDIHKWIKSLIEELAYEESYLHSALHQYKDYLEEYFYLKEEKYGKMKTEMRKLILDKISVDLPLEDKIEILSNMKNNIDSLKGEVEQLLNECKIEKEVQYWETKAIELSRIIGYKLESPYRFGHNVSDALGVILEKDTLQFMVCFAINRDKPYLGVMTCHNKFSQKFIDEIKDVFKNLGLVGSVSSKEMEEWIEWARIEQDKDWKNKFRTLVEKCKIISDNSDS